MDWLIFFFWRNWWIARPLSLRLHLRMEKMVKDQYMPGPIADAFRSTTWKELTPRQKRFLIRLGYEEMVKQ